MPDTESNRLRHIDVVLKKAVLLANRLRDEPNLSILDSVAGRLVQEASGIVDEIPRLYQMIVEIAQRQRRLDTAERPFLREPLALVVRTEIENFRHQLGGYREPLASAFRVASDRWLSLADHQWQEARAVVTMTPIPQVFRAGDPVDRNQEAFVPRFRVIGELEGQLTLATGCPGLVLYGRRRTGKSTTLKNLDGFLPREVRIATLSMQNPEAFTSINSLCRLIAAAASAQWPEEPNSKPVGLVELFSALNRANARAEDENSRLLLAIDEYENIDEKIGAGVLPIDLLAVLRESIQIHRRIIWIFAGCHHFAELPHAPWTSYLVSARTIEMRLFSEDETRLLLTEPLRWSGGDENSSFLPADLWGADGINRIHTEAGGWPDLVQLLAETTIDLLNESTMRAANDALLSRAFDRAIIRGELVLRQLVERECRLPGEWSYVSGFRHHDWQPLPDDYRVFESLRRRLLVVDESGVLRLRVMQRWLRRQG
jgi:hypothetical protein